MIIFNPIFNIYFIQKRYMQTSAPIKETPTSAQRLINENDDDTPQSQSVQPNKKTPEPEIIPNAPTPKRRVINENDEDETTIVPEITVDAPLPTESPKMSRTNQNLSEIKRKLDLPDPGNETCDPYIPSEPQRLYAPPILTKETLLTDVALKSIVHEVAQLGDSMGTEIKKSHELAHEWKGHILALDEYIKSLS